MFQDEACSRSPREIQNKSEFFEVGNIYWKNESNLTGRKEWILYGFLRKPDCRVKRLFTSDAFRPLEDPKLLFSPVRYCDKTMALFSRRQHFRRKFWLLQGGSVTWDMAKENLIWSRKLWRRTTDLGFNVRNTSSWSHFEYCMLIQRPVLVFVGLNYVQN